MSVDKYQPHVLILPEDDANRQMANGFMLYITLNARAIQALPIAGGWLKVREQFIATHITPLRTYQKRHLVLLFDFDIKNIETRTLHFQNAIPADVRERVYLLGTSDEPEAMKRDCKLTFEEIGKQLAKACAEEEPGLWNHPMLQHNQSELERLKQNVTSFLFNR